MATAATIYNHPCAYGWATAVILMGYILYIKGVKQNDTKYNTI